MNTFLKDMIERAVKSCAQGALAALGAGATGLIGVDWINVGSIALFAGLVSILTSIGSLGVGDDTASLVNIKKEGE